MSLKHLIAATALAGSFIAGGAAAQEDSLPSLTGTPGDATTA